MLKISKHSEYALKALIHLSKDPQKRISVREIANKHDLSFDLLSKILQKLKQKGYVDSVQGVTGGYYLVTELRKIYLVELLRVFEANFGLTACVSASNKKCRYEDNCVIRTPLRKINKSILNHIADITLDSFAEESN